MKPVSVLLAALALVGGAGAASAQATAPPRQRTNMDRAVNIQRIEACPIGSQAMLVEPDDVSFWLAQPTTASNPWLTSLPADLRATLIAARIDMDEVSVMCVPTAQRSFVESAQAQLNDLKLQSDRGE